MVERWRVVPGFPGYKVSDQGRVSSFRRVELRILQPRIIFGRYSIQLRNNDGKKRTLQIGALVLKVFGESNGEHRVFYINDDPSDNRLENLQWNRSNLTLKEGELEPVIIGDKEYVSIRDFAKLVNKSYQTIYLLARYGTHNGDVKLENIVWNNRRLVLLSEQYKIENIAPVGRPKQEKVTNE